MKFNKIIVLLSMLFIILIVSGCSLANPDKQDVSDNSDTLIGCFVTFGDDYKKIQNEINKDEELKKSSLNDIIFDDTKVEGVLKDNNDYEFEGLDGYLIYSNKYEKDIDGKLETFNDIYTDDGIYDTHLAIESKDDMNNTTIEGTIAVSRDMDDYMTVHRVFKRADNSVYVSLGGNRAEIAETFQSISIKNDYEEKINGEIKTGESIEVKISVECKNEFVNLYIYEMNKDNKIINTAKVDKSFFTDNTVKYKLQNETEYVIVEERNIDEARNTVINRSIYDYRVDSDGTSYVEHTCYIPLENKVLLPYRINFVK